MLTNFSGPLGIWGLLDYLQSSLGGSGPTPDPNQDAGPSMIYQGYGYPDLRVLFQKDQASGKTGLIPMLMAQPMLQSANVIPAATGTATIAALANVNSGTAMTLVGTNTIAAAQSIPICPIGSGQSAWQGSAVVSAKLMLDFGFAFLTGTAASNSWQCANSADFPIGMPLVIAGAGANAATPLLTWVTGQTDATHITTNDAAQRNVTATPVGSGNIWMPREGAPTIYPTAHVPFRASGVGIFLDPSQSLGRCVSVTGGTSAAGNAAGILISGWDVYGQPMTELIAAPAAASTTYGQKAFKAIASAVPQFSEAHQYSVGTGDTFGFAWRANVWEDVMVAWAGTAMTTSQGFLAAVTTAATSSTGDVRGTIQTGAAGNGTGIGATASNGTVSSLARSGNRLLLAQMPGVGSLTLGNPFAPQFAYGVPQA